MKKKKEIQNDPADISLEPGITVYYSQTSAAFMLITFMVGDLLLVSKTLASPVNQDEYYDLDEKSFVGLKTKILQNQAKRQFSHLTMRESIRMYVLVDLVCKCFVDDANETLKTLAINNVNVSAEEYDQLRINFLRYGQSLVETMNKKFASNELFLAFLTKTKHRI